MDSNLKDLHIHHWAQIQKLRFLFKSLQAYGRWLQQHQRLKSIKKLKKIKKLKNLLYKKSFYFLLSQHRE